MKPLLALLTPLLLTSLCSAQGFNVDMGTTNPVPAPTFGAAAGQTGTWNQVGALPVSGSAPLLSLLGAATPVVMTLTSGAPPSNFSSNNPLTSGNDELLMDDAVDPGSIIPAVYTFSGLSAGTYTVYTYAWAPDNANFRSSVSVNGGPVSSVGGAWTGGYTLGVTHAIDTVLLGAGANIVVSITDFATAATFNGIQIVQAGTPFTSFCGGEAIGTTCLACGNNGGVGRGCANSSSAVGARLVSSGIASLSADTVVLGASDLTGPALFLQANSLAASPMTFGDGMLCAAVGILRLGIVFPVAGAASYPGGLTPGAVSVGGAPISAGDTKHYQCWYRDAVAFCSASTFNLTNGISLTWAP